MSPRIPVAVDVVRAFREIQVVAWLGFACTVALFSQGECVFVQAALGLSQRSGRRMGPFLAQGIRVNTNSLGSGRALL